MRNVTYINAGAGSGKTYTLTRILAQKLSDEENVLNPSQVILTTFTSLAATEFREKARQQILAKGNFDSAAQMDSAVIGTVHSMALTFIKKFWYLLEYGAEVQTISERDADFYMSQSLSRVVNDEANRVHMQNFRRFRDYFNILDSNSHPDYLFWKNYLSTIVEKMEYYCVENIEESIAKSLDTVRSVYSGPAATVDDIDYIRIYLKKYLDYICGVDSKTAKKQITLVRELANFKDIGELIVLLGSGSMMKSPVGGATKIEKSCPGFGEFCEKVNKMILSSSNMDVIAPFIESVFRLAAMWRNDYIAYKENNHIISYNDMEKIFLRLLDNEEVKDYVRNNYRLVMVDEFQDSNPIQLKIFDKLSEIVAEGGGHSYWVGDPKQAIYGFRGADTDLVNSVSAMFNFYDDADVHAEEGERSLGTGRLVESWRSRESLVQLVNKVFKDSFIEDGINKLCIELQPHFTADDLSKPAIVSLKCGAGDNNDALACKIKEILNSEMLVHSGRRDEAPTKITPRDIAVLCRENSSCSAIVKALRKYGVPVSESEDSIMQRIEVQLVVNILQFVQEPDNKSIIANLMRLLWGRSTAEILRDRIAYVNDAGNVKDCWMRETDEEKRLLEMREEIKHLPIPEMVRAIGYKSNAPALVARWGDEQIRRQNLSTLLHLAEDYDQMCLQMGLGASISGFIYYLDSIEPDKEKDNRSNTVKVFTYHGSKGLEWPLVIMTDIDKDALKDSYFTRKSFMRVREIVREDKGADNNPLSKEYYIHCFPNTLSTSNSNPVAPLQEKITTLELYEKFKSRIKSEERRLLYVGMTRAKDYLYTFDADEKYSWLENVGVKVKPDDVWGCGTPTTMEVCSAEEETAKGEASEYCIVSKPTERTSRGKKYLSPSKEESFEGYSNHHLWKKGGKGLASIGWKETDYAGAGSCIHDIFAIYRRGSHEEIREKALRIIYGYGYTATLSDRVDDILQSADWLYSQLQEAFPQREGDAVYNEYPFEVRLNTGEHLRGEIDLLWLYSDENGRHCVIVDYKTFPGVDINAHTKKYYAQMSAYSHALRSADIDVAHTFVYYPLQGVINEVV